MEVPAKKPQVTVVLPAYNEASVVGDTVRKIKHLYPDFEVLVVDDGSTDGTLEAAMAAGANVWPHPYNIGNGAAIKTGLRCAQGEWVVMMDADGQHQPEDLARLLEHKDRYDMVVGARTRKSKTKIHRDLANWLYNKMASYVTQFAIIDLTSGFRLVRLSTAKQFIYLLPNTFSYPSTLTMAYLRSGRSIKYIPIDTKERIGKSKIKLIKDGTRFFLIITRIATLFSPLRVFLPISILLFFSGVFYYGYTFITQGRFTNMSALLFNSSIIVFMIGLVAEQISQMRYDRIE
ncbi:glycosyltransferase family 2 protein [Desulfofustis glycolicus]|uniref:Glycosyltransferase involved in cell wall bisynthesis n=1 Tax=Desulfofustis glycolicus DSM 9705 TaxID=1121409 RepID=A0A1M5YXX4_9BACT|nr:glycosyltransferase family 2 protein [Desulfofustis glycolicus]SHI16694.1 Glycosyltransferase involved in cell wall bisynthesis [Desulfofustis glycolicus DSM 9705]